MAADDCSLACRGGGVWMCQIRLLADTCLLMQDYESALANYKLARVGRGPARLRWAPPSLLPASVVVPLRVSCATLLTGGYVWGRTTSARTSRACTWAAPTR